MATRRDDLEALRDLLRAALPEAIGNELPAISRELRMVLAELDAIPDANSNSPVDEVTRRREERRQRAAGRAEAEA